MSRASVRDRSRAFALVAPLVLFLALFFVWPLWTMVTASVVDDAVTKVLPRTAVAMADWDGSDLPPPAVHGALAEDLRAAQDQQALGEAVRRLNSAVSGFRTLLTRTVTAAREASDPAALDFAAVDPRWNEPRFWRAIKEAVPPYTDRNLLAALDLRRDAGGSIVAEEPGAAANRIIMLRTFVIAGSVTLACAAIGLPYAMLAAAAGGIMRALLLLAVLVPLWTSLLVRTAAWFILLQQEGLINRTLASLGIIDAPLPLIFNRLGVIIAMTHVLLPFMVLPIYSVLIAVPRNLMPAAASLGAGPIRAFWRVLLPLAMPGLMSGCLLVFMVAIGYYITPALVGGANDQMISSVIAFYALGTANWGMAGALGLILLAVTLLLYLVYGRLSRSPQLPGA
ncbi:MULTISPECIES: ABC transporter permease [unclassified Chelatococcus]|uniref:ABC transporter permease n=1 Tax=unclassified Chelatococcus TaxID=2638111 RepID=UPI0002D84C9D|nr:MULTISPECIES: ABC transporter permease [unclassified Chelatococcus]ALA18067.1 ABC transporter permease [Chelatococcus sp. CO-6]